MGKRANGEGTYRLRPNGDWEARLSYTDPDTGERKRASFYGKTQRAARAELNKARDRLDAGSPVRDATDTLAAWLEHWRTTTLAVSDRKPSTRSLYDRLARNHLEPAPLGTIALDRLRPSHVEALILRMRTTYKPAPADADLDHEPVRALADATVLLTYHVLRTALDGAVRDGLLARNPAAAVKRPTVQRTEARYLDVDEVAALLRAAESSRYHPALVLIAATGLRSGECLALRWDAVDLDAGTLRVTATVSAVAGRLTITEPKTVRSRREVPLNPAVVAMLRRHRAAQLAERMRAANVWTDHGLVFATQSGGPVAPGRLLETARRAAAAAGIEGVRVHTLRHSAAVAWLEAGVHIRGVADLLGHSSIATTGDVYGHTSDATARAAVDGLADRLGLADGGGI
ncbi:tyrosine-type recombinase/integrase [Mycolicibacterium psychrotolerans]|uniref:tyrosine-type recombinase/integrase n=1 Tax=Mycolicibacterium psychrotolerans TaxID=216929 RepID=UPI003D672834